MTRLDIRPPGEPDPDTVLHVWLRAETRSDEYRTPLTPSGAARLVADGAQVSVEESPHRIFATAEYAAAGCTVTPPGSWVNAPGSAVVLGLKELPERPVSLRHRHIYFGHVYKGQPGASRLLARFAAGGGELLDLEQLVDRNGRRLVAFGYWAGYVGAALAVLRAAGALTAPLRPTSAADLAARLRAADWHGRAIVVGALGRCGRGALAAFADAGVQATGWDVAETARLDKAELLDHDLLVNTVLASTPGSPLLRPADLRSAERRLRLVTDVSCDVGSECNALPIYDATTTWAAPVRTLPGGVNPVELIALDNLPSLVPREASTDFSDGLVRLLPLLAHTTGPWAAAQRRFHTAAKEI